MWNNIQYRSIYYSTNCKQIHKDTQGNPVSNTISTRPCRRKKFSTIKSVKKSLQPTQNSTHTSCLSMCTLWHVEFLNEQECVHKRLSSPLHLGTLHDVFVQMISLAHRQPNYLSSSVSSEPKLTSALTHTHRPIHIPQGCLSATLLPQCVMEAITLLLRAASVELWKTHFAPRYRSCLHHRNKTHTVHLGVSFFTVYTTKRKMCIALNCSNSSDLWWHSRLVSHILVL